MRFNKQELVTLATQPSNKFEKEGALFVTEKQEGFFRKTEGDSKTLHQKRNKSLSCIGGTTKVSLEKWCRLRGNLLFYFKSNDQFSEPQGCIVLEKYKCVKYNEQQEFDGFVFYLEFEDGLRQRLAAHTNQERTDWIQSISLAGYDVMRAQLKYLREQIDKKSGRVMDVDVDMLRLQTGKEIDLNEIPICESAICCDNLFCDGNGKPPNPSVVVQVTSPTRAAGWIKYGRTEVVEKCSNPQFVCTIVFRACDGLNSKSQIRFTAYDVREKVSQTAVPIGSAEIALGVIQDTTRLRIPLRSQKSTNAGFITIATCAPEMDSKKTHNSPAKAVSDQQSFGHRRSQSLPPKLGVKLFVPPQARLSSTYANPIIHTYRLHSGLGGDINVHEIMLESQLCFIIPQQLLSIWIMREKELLQEISGMGELGGEWRHRQMELLDKHLKLLKDYSQAKQYLHQQTTFFKQSAKKGDETLEFAPVNLHLQRMWAHNETLKRAGVLDVITVGAFTRHSGKSKTGGLIKLLHQIKDSPSKYEQNGHKVTAANDAVQAIKQLRKEIVEIMSQLLCLAKSKNPKGMLPLCTEMMSKTRALLNIWEPSLVEEAFAFIECHRIIEENTPNNNNNNNNSIPMSPFRKITQQLGALDLKSPELEDFSTPMGPAPDLWPQIRGNKSGKINKSPSSLDISTISTIQSTFKQLNMVSSSLPTSSCIPKDEKMASDEALKFKETHFDVNGEVVTSKSEFLTAEQLLEHKNELLSNVYDENGYLIENTSIVLGHNGAFLDTKVMSSSPSANYYRPTEEPEPLDLTQLNIEASVMCLVSKVKFLCGRCGSPAVRLRQPKCGVGIRGFGSIPPDVVTSQPISLPSTSEEKVTAKPPLCSKDLNLALTQAVGEVTRKVKKGNKFTDGLDLSLTTDWASELRPSMKKLRQAMDGLLKTARLMHSVQRLQQDMKKTSATLAIMYRRDVCFSQALTTLVSGLMAKLWGQNVTGNYINLLCNLGPLACFEGLLSLYGGETDMWGDMSVAIEDLSTVRFTLVRSNIQRDSKAVPIPRVIGSRQSITVLLPVPETVYCNLPTKESVIFKVTPVFFNIGINEKATISETLGFTKEQHRSNWDNYDRLKQYHSRYKKIHFNYNSNASSNLDTPNKRFIPQQKEVLVSDQTIGALLNDMEDALRANTSKNYKILTLAEDIARYVQGLRFTSCKSAKDRTSMAVTMEQCRVLQQEFHLPANSMQNSVDTMRSEGTRSDNTMKNIGLRKYAFNLPQVLSLPQVYRPPAGAYGKAQS